MRNPDPTSRRKRAARMLGTLAGVDAILAILAIVEGGVLLFVIAVALIANAALWGRLAWLRQNGRPRRAGPVSGPQERSQPHPHRVRRAA